MKQFFVLLILAIATFICCPALADFTDGIDAYEKGDYKTALREFKPLAEKGDSDAQFYLGAIYRTGGVQQDYKEAIKWYRLSAEQGNVEAQVNLGLMYGAGQGVPRDRREAIKWVRRAAEQRYAEAQFNLGAAYYSGEGVPQDYILAHMWFNLSASNGEDGAAAARDIVAKKLTPEQITEAQKLARECLVKDYKGC